MSAVNERVGSGRWFTNNAFRNPVYFKPEHTFKLVDVSISNARKRRYNWHRGCRRGGGGSNLICSALWVILYVLQIPREDFNTVAKFGRS